MKPLANIIIVSLLASLPITVSANLVTNPGFETGNFTGWSVSGSSASLSTPHSGAYGFLSAQFGSLATISQNLSTVAGITYDLDFWLANISDGGTTVPNRFEVSWNGSLVPGSVLINSNAFGYTQFTFTGLLATSSSTALQFGFRHDPQFWTFDDVSVTAALVPSVPETFSTLWLALPLGLLFLLRRHLLGEDAVPS